jgi:transposase
MSSPKCRAGDEEAPMRGYASKQGPMLLLINVEDKVPQDHPLRAVKQRCDAILADMRRDFNAACCRVGRPSIPPEQLLKALLLQRPENSVRGLQGE